MSTYRQHQNDEHLEALIEDALKYTGLHLEADLGDSSFWGEIPLTRRVAMLLHMVDQGIVERRVLKGRRVYQPKPDAETWVLAQTAFVPYLEPALELLTALRRELARRTRASRA